MDREIELIIINYSFMYAGFVVEKIIEPFPFALPVYDESGEIERYNVFSARLLIRHAASGKRYLYDILEIKKETSKSCQE